LTLGVAASDLFLVALDQIDELALNVRIDGDHPKVPAV